MIINYLCIIWHIVNFYDLFNLLLRRFVKSISFKQTTSMRWGKFFNILVFLIIITIFSVAIILPRFTSIHLPFSIEKSENAINFKHKKIKQKAFELKQFAKKNGYDTAYSFLIDMSIPSGYKRFFIYDNYLDTIINEGMVAHGSCNTTYLEEVQFSNTNGCGCSSYGKYKIDYAYFGNYGKAYKLRGLDASNSNAFERNIVLHSYSCVPNEETYPSPICNSLGCPMVSYDFLQLLMIYIKKSKKPILLWIL